MNKFDRAVKKKTNELIEKNVPEETLDEDILKKFSTIARAMIREEIRNPQKRTSSKSLYRKTWKAAEKYGDFNK
jgi:hypothetical protein